MSGKYRVACDVCGTRYLLARKKEGKKGRCLCGHRFVLPYSGRASFAKKAPLKKISLYLQSRPDCASTRQMVTRIYKNRLAKLKRQWREEQHSGIKSIDDLLGLSPAEFEAFIAQLYVSRGYQANAVGGSADGGVDVEIFASNGTELWAVAQCKRYATDHKIGSSVIRDFAGAFVANEAKQGLFFTTSSYTRQAISSARNYPWLTLYDGSQIVDLIRKIEIGV